jgi:hypothetical protein
MDKNLFGQVSLVVEAEFQVELVSVSHAEVDVVFRQEIGPALVGQGILATVAVKIRLSGNHKVSFIKSISNHKASLIKSIGQTCICSSKLALWILYSASPP